MDRSRFIALSSEELHAHGSAARAVGDYAEAIQVWEELTLREPGQWQPKLSLALDTLELHGPETARTFFIDIFKEFPDCYWVAHHACVKGQMWLSPEELRNAGERWHKQFPQEVGPLLFLAETSQRQLDHHQALVYIDQVIKLEPQNDQASKLQHKSRLYLELHNTWAQKTKAGFDCNERDYEILVINMDHSMDRWERILSSFDKSKQCITRVPGVRGSYLPTRLVSRLTGNRAARRGTLGVFLSHLAAWEKVLLQDLDHGLILEDDSVPLVTFPISTCAMGFPADYDICFVNKRMEIALGDQEIDLGNIPCFVSPSEVIERWTPELNAPGGDGYMLSRRGAEKLLSIIESEDLNGDVDWRLLAYAVPEEAIKKLRSGTIVRSVLTEMSNKYHTGILKAYSMFPCLVDAASSSSTRSSFNLL